MPKTLLRMFSQGLPQDMVQLGSLTIDGIQPWADIIHPSRSLPASYIREAIDSMIRDSFENATNTSFKIFLTKMLKLAISSEESQQARIGAARRVTRYLGNHEQAFDFLTDEAAAGDSVRGWLQKRVNRRQDILMIVRTDTFVDASVLWGHTSSHSVEGDASFSPSQANPALAVLGDIADIGVSLGAKRERTLDFGFRGVGERIYAVEYRRVSWSWLKQAQGHISAATKIFKSLQPAPWTRGAVPTSPAEGGAAETKTDANDDKVAGGETGTIIMFVEKDGPQYTREELEDEEMESYIERDEGNEVEYVFDADSEENSED